MKLLVNAPRLAALLAACWLGFPITLVAGGAPVVAVGAVDLSDWKGISVGGVTVPGEISFRYPDGPKGWYQEGLRISHDGSADWRGFSALQIDLDVSDDEPVEISARIAIPDQSTREDFVSSTTSIVSFRGKGARTVTLPWSGFDFKQAQPAFLKFVKELTFSIKGEVGRKIAVKGIRLVKAPAVSLEAEVRGKSEKSGKTVSYPVRVGNTTAEPQVISLQIVEQGWQTMRASVVPERIQLAPGETTECLVSVSVPPRMPQAGREIQTLRAVANGDGSRANTIQFTTVHRLDAPYILHTPERWEEVRKKVRTREWAALEQEKYVQTSTRWEVPEVAKPPGNKTPDNLGTFLFATQEEHKIMAAGYAWQLTRDPHHAEKVATFLRRLSDPQTGYPTTLRGCNQSFVQEGHFFQHMAMAYDMIGDSGVLSEKDREQIARTFRLYIESDLLDLDSGAISNWSVSQHCGALYSALAIQDLSLADRILNGPAGIIDHMTHGIMDDGWWYECSISYNVWVATEFAQVALAMQPWGVNLVEGWVPVGYSKNHGMRPWEAKEGLYGMSFEKWGPVKSTHVSLKRFWDALPVFADYRGIIFGINDTTEKPLGGAGFELAYRLFGDPAYAAIIKSGGQRDLIYGVPDLPEETPDLSGVSAHADNVGVAMLRSKQRDAAERIQAVLHYGTHGSYHGHFDRGGLLSLMRYGKSFFNPQMIWYTYQSFLYKFYVQTSMSKNMVVVDQKQQEPVESDLLLFHTGDLMQAAAVETNARWADPPFGGMRYPELPATSLEEKLWMEGRSFGIPADAKPYGEIGDYGDPVRQRRLMVVTDDYVVLADSLQAEREHVYDSLFQIKGFKGLTGEHALLRHDGQMTRDGKSAAQFVTDCDWFTTKGPQIARFDHDGLKLDVHPLWPDTAELMVASAPESQPVNKQLHYTVRAAGKTLAEGRLGAWILGQVEIDVPVEDVDSLELETRVNSVELKTIFWGNARIVREDGSEVLLADLPSQRAGLASPPQAGRDYEGGPIKIAGVPFAAAIGGQPAAKDTPGILTLDLRGSRAKRFKATLGGDYPVGDESAQRKTLSIRQQGKEARYLTLIEPRRNEPVIKRASADGADHLTVELTDGRIHEIRLSKLATSEDRVEVKIIEKMDGKILREESSRKEAE